MTSDFTLMEDESSTLTMEQAGLKPNNRITYTEINNQVTPKGSWRIMSHHEDGLHSDSAQCWHNNLQKAICIYNLPFSLLSSRPRPRPQLPMSPMLTLQACVTHTHTKKYISSSVPVSCFSTKKRWDTIISCIQCPNVCFDQANTVSTMTMMKPGWSSLQL